MQFLNSQRNKWWNHKIRSFRGNGNYFKVSILTSQHSWSMFVLLSETLRRQSDTSLQGGKPMCLLREDLTLEATRVRLYQNGFLFFFESILSLRLPTLLFWKAMDLPLEENNLSLIFATDWILQTSSTALSSWGDFLPRSSPMNKVSRCLESSSTDSPYKNARLGFALDSFLTSLLLLLKR